MEVKLCDFYISIHRGQPIRQKRQSQKISLDLNQKCADEEKERAMIEPIEAKAK